MRRWLAIAGATALVAVAGTLPARSQDSTELGGFILEASASAVEYTYASPGLLPTGDVIFQAAMPRSYTRLSTGPTGRALSSLAWPGPLLSDLGVIVEQGTSEDQQPPFRIPSYPVRAEAFNPQGPASDENELVPGARMRAVSEGLRSHADGRFTGMQLPLLFDIGGVVSEATSEIVDGVAVSRSTAALSDVSLLGGLIRIDGLVTELTTTSNGDEATATGTTTATGVTFAGLRATIDERGIHLADQPAGGNDATRQVTDNVPFDQIADGLNQGVEPISDGLRQLLDGVGGGLNELAEQSGITIRLFPTTSTIDGAAADAVSSGLYIELFYDGRTTPVFSELLDALPVESLPSDPLLPLPFNSSPQALVSLLRETHINSISLATGSVTANAAPSFTLPPFDFGPLGDPPGGGGSFGGGAVLGTGFTGPSPGSGPVAPGAGPGAALDRPTAEIGGAPVASGTPLPGTLVVVAVVSLPFFAAGARRLARMSLGT